MESAMNKLILASIDSFFCSNCNIPFAEPVKLRNGLVVCKDCVKETDEVSDESIENLKSLINENRKKHPEMYDYNYGRNYGMNYVYILRNTQYLLFENLMKHDSFDFKKISVKHWCSILTDTIFMNRESISEHVVNNLINIS